MKAIITGGAGFIGSNLADALLARGDEVVAVDNLSAGHREFFAHHLNNPKYQFVQLDLKDADATRQAFACHADIVFHFAANADVKGGTANPTVDLREGCMVTSNVLEAMRANNIKKIAYSSTGSVYGEPEIFPTPEDAPFPIQTSMYAASKLYGEGLIQSYCEGYGFQCWIFRFVSIMGERYTHGVVFSFYQQLLQKGEITFLSDGTPQKSYLYVGDCVRAMLHAIEHAKEKVNRLNLGTPEEITVNEIAEIVLERLGKPGTRIIKGSQPRGWVGDSPHILLDVKKMMALGWKPQLTIKEAILRTVDWLEQNQWALGEQYFRRK